MKFNLINLNTNNLKYIQSFIYQILLDIQYIDDIFSDKDLLTEFIEMDYNVIICANSSKLITNIIGLLPKYRQAQYRP